MTPAEAAWLGTALLLLLLGVRWLGHYLSCTCSTSRRARAIRNDQQERI